VSNGPHNHSRQEPIGWLLTPHWLRTPHWLVKPLLATLLLVHAGGTCEAFDNFPPRDGAPAAHPGDSRDRETAYAPITLRGPSTSLTTTPRPEQVAGPVGAEGALSGDSDVTTEAAELAPGSSIRRSMMAPLVTIGSSMALVLGLFAAFVWVSKKAQRGGGGSRLIPDEVLRVLGHKNLGTLGHVSLVRCGRSILVVSSSPTGVQSLATITDESEVRHLEAACLGESGASFQATLGEIEREPTGQGFLGEGIAHPHARKRLFAQA
jgi:flagellar biogenesis protein FliO